MKGCTDSRVELEIVPRGVWLMTKALYVGLAAAALLALGGCVALRGMFKGTTWHPDLKDKRLDERESVDLEGLGTVSLPPSFRFLGLADTETGYVSARGATSAEFHHDDERAVFRFEQGNMTDWGGNSREPVLLNILFLNPSLSPDPARDEGGFSVWRYYSPMKDETIAQTAPPWSVEDEGGLRWRWLEMDDHFGTDHQPRVAVILFDPSARIRLDFFAWKKEYELADARALLRGILAETRPSPDLAAHFAIVSNFDERMDVRREANLAKAQQELVAAGAPTFAAGQYRFSPNWAVWLDDDRKSARIARYLGAVSLDGAERGYFNRPAIPLAPAWLPKHEGGTAKYEQAIPISVLYWDESASVWRQTDLRRRTADEDEALHPFFAAIAERLSDHSSAHLFVSGFYYHPPSLEELTEVPADIASAGDWQKKLAGGELTTSAVTSPTFSATP